MIILNSLFPVLTLILLGKFFRKSGWTSDGFLKRSDRLVYYIFFPVMLFWKIGRAVSPAGSKWNYCIACVCAVVAVYILSLIYIIFRVDDYEAGTFSQSCYRFNTYIGMAVIITALGEEAATIFGILIGFAIPIINILAVGTLIWFSGQKYSFWGKIKMMAKAMMLNPLIIACVAGILYSRTVNFFPVFIDNTFRLISSLTLPLALFSIGGSLTFANLKEYFNLAMAAAFFKLLILPLAGYYFLNLFRVSGIYFKVSMIFFTLPTSVALYVLSAQLNSNTDFASASIVLSTMLSFVTLSFVLIKMA